MLYVVVYDIASNRRRYRVDKLMRRYGLRGQYSLFECDMTTAQVRRLVEKLLDLIDPAEDSLKIYPVCATCLSGAVSLGIREIYRPEKVVVI